MSSFKTKSLRRKMKNVIQNYSDCERWVRDATCNEPWGASTTSMMRIAEATHDPERFPLIMGMIWKRMAKKGKFWRHVYKSLTLLEYCVKTGADAVLANARNNIASLRALETFQFINKDGRDEGRNVREKSRSLISLMSDEDRLADERERAMKAKQRIQAHNAVSSSGKPVPPTASWEDDAAVTAAPVASFNDAAQVAEAEEAQIRLAMQMSLEEASPAVYPELQFALELSRVTAAEDHKRRQNLEEEELQRAVHESLVVSPATPPKCTNPFLMATPSSSSSPAATLPSPFGPFAGVSSASEGASPFAAVAAPTPFAPPSSTPSAQPAKKCTNPFL